MPRGRSVIWWFIALALLGNPTIEAQNVTENEIRPYEFTFNIVDFQHRSEKKGNDGLITGEYGFITADGIYHETAYATDKAGDFIITKMKHRKIMSLKDAEEIFKDKPEQAKMLAEALMKSCEGCDLSELDRQETSSFVRSESTTIPPKKVESRLEKKLDLAMKEMMKVLNKKNEDNDEDAEADKLLSRKEKKLSGGGRLSSSAGVRESAPATGSSAINGTANEIIRDMIEAGRRALEAAGAEEPASQRGEAEEALERMANELFYRFNYTISSHGHWEDGFRNGRKDGEYNSKFREGVDAHVKYVSNEFGHQPNITLVPRKQEDQALIIESPAEHETVAPVEIVNSSSTTTSTTTSEPNPYTGHYFSWFRK